MLTRLIPILEHTLSNNAQHMTRSMPSIGDATRELTQNLLSISSAFGLINQVLNIIEALLAEDDTLLNLHHMLISGGRVLTWRETVGILVLRL